MKFRRLKAGEIECRPATIKANGLSILLYKDARVDMNILDESVGSLNWKREHTRDNANCIVSIWDSEKEQWVSKEDTGTESNTEKEKGLASDSFKRACFNWGIGRELYSAPFIWVGKEVAKIVESNGYYKCNDKFKVSSIDYDSEGNICQLEITNQRNEVAYRMGDQSAEDVKPYANAKDVERMRTMLDKYGVTEEFALKTFKRKSLDLFTPAQYTQLMQNIEKMAEMQKGE